MPVAGACGLAHRALRKYRGNSGKLVVTTTGSCQQMIGESAPSNPHHCQPSSAQVHSNKIWVRRLADPRLTLLGALDTRRVLEGRHTGAQLHIPPLCEIPRDGLGAAPNGGSAATATARHGKQVQATTLKHSLTRRIVRQVVPKGNIEPSHTSGQELASLFIDW